MIEIKGVCKYFGNIRLFDNLNLVIPDGAFAVITGPSGCGKTTLLNMIGGLDKVSGGEILVDGIKISGNTRLVDYYRNTVGFLFQNFALVEKKTVKQNLELIHKSSVSGVSVDEALEQVGLLTRKNEKVYKLSGGEQQRVALARLMVKKCSVILADEPTGSLDKENANQVISILQKLNNMGKTIIMVTHNQEFKTIATMNIELSQKEERLRV
ncbi:MAG: ABC transporter ATP-binding protein [Lachnospiraceae bacterium]